jgi:hypothetical protein
MSHCLLYKLLLILYTRRYGRYLVEWRGNIQFFIARYILKNGKKKQPDSQTILIHMRVMRLFYSLQWTMSLKHHDPHTSSGDHSASYLMDAGGSFLRGKADRTCSYHSPPFSTEVKNAWSYTSTLLYVSTMRCLIKHRDNFTMSLKYFTVLYFICRKTGELEHLPE